MPDPTYFNFTVRGVDEFYKNLATLQDKMQKRIARKAARKGMNIVRNAARRNARRIDQKDTPLNIAKEIVTAEATRSGKRLNAIVMRVGVRGGARSSDQKLTPWYWRLVELGSQHNQPARPFMLPALEQNYEKVSAKVAEVLSAELDKELAKAAPASDSGDGE